MNSFILTSIFMLVLLQPITSETLTLTLEETCKRASPLQQSYTFCMETLTSFSGSKTANTTELAIMTAKEENDVFVDLYQKLYNMSIGEETPSPLKAAIKECSDNYGLADYVLVSSTIDSLKIVWALPEQYIVFALAGLSGAVEYMVGCELALMKSGVKFMFPEEEEKALLLNGLATNLVYLVKREYQLI